jgi:predicted nucleic acid-binding Zn finger protein
VDPEGRVTIQGTVRGEQRIQTCHLILDRDERMVGGECTCSFYAHNKLHKGPCEHILALRVRYHAH